MQFEGAKEANYGMFMKFLAPILQQGRPTGRCYRIHTVASHKLCIHPTQVRELKKEKLGGLDVCSHLAKGTQ